MARGQKRSKIEMITKDLETTNAEIVKVTEELKNLKNKAKELNKDLKQAKIEELANLIEEKNIDTDALKILIEKNQNEEQEQ